MPKTQNKSGRRAVVSNSSDESDNETPQPQKRQNKAAANNDTDYEDASSEASLLPNGAPCSSSSQQSSSQVERMFIQMSIQDRERIANDIVRYLLVADRKKILIRQADVKKYATKEYSRAFGSLMQIARQRLKSIFGIEVVETDVGKQKAYILINTLDNDSDSPHQTWSDEDHAVMGLVIVILSAIFMKGNILGEDDLYDLLRRLNIQLDRPDDTFGDVKHLLMTDFVRRGYLEVEKEQGSDPPTHFFRWGPRAKAETNKHLAMDFMCQVYGEECPQRWTAQMHDIEQTEPHIKAARTPNGSKP